MKNIIGNMIYFILGILTGIQLSILAIKFVKDNQMTVEHTINKGYPSKPGKAEFFDSGSLGEDAIEEEIEKNDEQNKPTQLSEIL